MAKSRREYGSAMIDDDTELPFTLFIATAQLLVGIGLIVFATSAAVRISGVVVIAFALLTGGSAWYYAHRRGQRLFRLLASEADRADEPEGQSSQGPRQPPNPDASR